MKFGKFLRSQEVPGWEFYYLSYNRIKKTLVSKSGADLNREFQQALEKELEKINSFYALKSDQLYNDVLQVKHNVKSGNTSETNDKELDRIATELIQLERYQKLNILGFAKLLKKHDKHSGVEAKEWFMLRVEDQPFVKKDLDKILLQLSQTWKVLNLARTKQTVLQRNKQNEDVPSAQNFERKTTKYWVPVDRVMEVKTMIIKHLPIDVFDKSIGRSDNLTTSVYYDSQDLYLYHDRLQRQEGAVNLRMRTYGPGTDQPTVFVERKTHHDSWVGESSVKQRFSIKSKKLYDFLQGNYNLDEKLKKAFERKEMKEKEVQETLKLSHEIQELVISKKLQPTVITRYTRTAFQLGRDATVRMSLDTDLHMIAEHGYQGNRWGRDLSQPVDESDICWFPYAILEVKLNLPSGMDTPSWITEILQRNNLTTVYKFSKFIHGCAVLFPQRVHLLPTWLPLLEKKPDVDPLYATFLKVEHATKTSRQSTPKTKHSPKEQPKGEIQVVTEKPPTTSTPPTEIRKRPPLFSKKANEVELESAPLIINEIPKEDISASGSPKNPWWRKPWDWFMAWKNKKRTQIPIKIDPKTFFANERTLLHWLSFLVIVQSIGIALMRFSSSYESWRIGGLIFVVISLLFMGYAIVRYEQRRIAIASKSRGPYSDRFGPPILVGLLLAAVLVNIILAYKIYFVNKCTGVDMLSLNFVKYEPADVVYQESSDRLIATQPNTIVVIHPHEFTTQNYYAQGSHQAVALTSNPDLVFLGNVYPPSIDEYSLSQSKTLRRFMLTIPGSNATNGLSAMTFLPMSNNAEGGVFWVGSSTDGAIREYQLPLVSNSSSTSAVLLGIFYPIPGVTEITSLDYHAHSNLVFGIMDQWLFSMLPNNHSVPVAKTLLGFPDPTGVAISGSGKGMSAYISCGSCSEIWRFPFANGDHIASGRCYPPVTSESGNKLTP